MTRVRILLLILLTATTFVQAHFSVAGSASITDLMAEKEKKDASLHKLTVAERKALDFIKI